MITTKEFIDRIAEESGFTKTDTKKTLQAIETVVFDIIREGESVKLMNGFSLGVKNVPARTGRNPRTGEAISIAAKKSPFAKFGKPMKDAANV